jgi:hypothetical protein
MTAVFVSAYNFCCTATFCTKLDMILFVAGSSLL